MVDADACSMKDEVYRVVYRLAEPSQLLTSEPDRIFICPALLGPSAGLLGAALLPRFSALKQQSANTSLTPEVMQ